MVIQSLTAPDIQSTPTLEVIAQSVQGPRNETNEDSYLSLPEWGIFAVADGMGGRGHGDLASQLTLQTLKMSLQALSKRRFQETDIIAAIKVANHRVYERSRQDMQVRGMGTTLVVVWLNDERLYCFHVGDSRLYLLRDFCLTQVTVDHSASTQLVEQGKAKPGAITRAIGVKADVEIEVNCDQWVQQDLLLLVTDGITDPVANYQINNILVKKVKQSSEYVSQLLQESLNQGGSDDKTVVLIRHIGVAEMDTQISF